MNGVSIYIDYIEWQTRDVLTLEKRWVLSFWSDIYDTNFLNYILAGREILEGKLKVEQ